MTIGYSAAGHCWASESEALDAYYSNAQPSLLQAYSTGADSSWGYMTGHFVKNGSTWQGVFKYQFMRGNYPKGSPFSHTYNAPTNVVSSCTIAESSGSSSVPTGLPADFDYTILGALFAFSFSVVVGLWLFGRSAGSIVNIFKPK